MRWFWAATAAAIVARLAFIFLAGDLHLGLRPEVATPVTSLRRLAEGYWLKESSMSPYSGSMYHGSPLLLSVLGPLVTKRMEGQPPHFICSLVFVIVDLITALLVRSTGRVLQLIYNQTLSSVNPKLANDDGDLDAGDVASLIYLWNPLTIITCVGSTTSPIDNMMILVALYGACSCLPPVAAFGWVFATHLSLYPVILVIPIILLLGYGPDSPPKIVVKDEKNAGTPDPAIKAGNEHIESPNLTATVIHSFSWRPVVSFTFWAVIWATYVILLSSVLLNNFGGLSEMFQKTHGFMLTVQDLSPNIGIFWYFFAEVFDFFREFFLIVFHVNILFMVLPLAISLKHRPCFLAFVYIVVCSMLKPYPSVADSALYLSLMGLFINELREMKFLFFLFWGYIGVSLLSPVMHNLWIWRGTGNANFYFATGIAYACLQTILIVESVGTMLKHDRLLKKQLAS